MPSLTQQSQSEPKQTMYFQRGQAILLAEHPADLTAEEIVRRIQRTQLVAGSEDLSTAVVDKDRVQTFKHGSRVYDLPQDDHRRATQPWFSLVFFDLSEPLMSRRQLVRLIDDLNGQILDNPQLQPDNELTLRAASPIWLAAPAGDPIGGSGPGARPAPACQLPPEFHNVSVDTRGTPFWFELMNFPYLVGSAMSDTVEVAILDTAPDYRALANAYYTWYEEHPLLRGLLGAHGQFGQDNALEIIYAVQLNVRLPAPEELHVRHHNYNMADHGLFAAGIIHSIAPKARLRLIEVLNEHGVGTLESIGRGLSMLADERARNGSLHPLVVNCSLTITMPLKGHPTRDLDDRWTLFAKNSVNPNDPQFKLLSLSLEWICSSLDGPNVAIVAAAGNDAEGGTGPGGSDRPQARYPAAFDTVLGVGALLEGISTPAGYSNMSDRPDGSGIATFGGAQNAATGKAEEDTGVLGVYIGEFPAKKQDRDPDDESFDKLHNDSGWAWWAGTSFAAPIISGTLAALIGPTPDLNAAKAELSNATSAVIDSIGSNFPVQQGT